MFHPVRSFWVEMGHFRPGWVILFRKWSFWVQIRDCDRNVQPKLVILVEISHFRSKMVIGIEMVILDLNWSFWIQIGHFGSTLSKLLMGRVRIFI